MSQCALGLFFRAVLSATAGLLLIAGSALAGPPPVIWSQANPGGLAASVGAVAWAPSGTLVATGLSDSWVRIRNGANGQQVSPILQPRRSHGVVRLQFSSDSQFLAVSNSAGPSQYRIYQVATWTFLGLLQRSVNSKSIIHFTADAQLAAAPGGAGQLSKWKLSDLPVFVSSGSGYDVVVTRLQLSPNGTQETAVAKGTVTVRRMSDGAVLATVRGFVRGVLPELRNACRLDLEPEPDPALSDHRLRTHPHDPGRQCRRLDPAGLDPGGQSRSLGADRPAAGAVLQQRQGHGSELWLSGE